MSTDLRPPAATGTDEPAPGLLARRDVRLLLVVLVVAAAGLVAFLELTGGGAGAPLGPASGVPRPASRASSASPTAAATTGPDGSGRNPFAAGSTGGASSGGPGVVDGATPSTAPTVTRTVTAPAPPAVTRTVTATATAGTTDYLALGTVSAGSAQLILNSAVWTVPTGQTFGAGYTFTGPVTVNGRRCAAVSHAGAAIQVCPGEVTPVR